MWPLLYKNMQKEHERNTHPLRNKESILYYDFCSITESSEQTLRTKQTMECVLPVADKGSDPFFELFVIIY